MPDTESTTLYRLAQLEKNQQSQFSELKLLLKDMSDNLTKIRLQQEVHMKQTELTQINNEEKMDDLDSKICDIGDKVDSLASDAIKNEKEVNDKVSELKLSLAHQTIPGGIAGTLGAVVVAIAQRFIHQ